MTHPAVSRRQLKFLAAVVPCLVVVGFFLHEAVAQPRTSYDATTWKGDIAVSHDDSTETVTFNFQKSSSGANPCPYAVPQNGNPPNTTGKVNICQGDTIQWQVITPAHPGPKGGHLYVYQGDNILYDGHGNKTKWLKKDEGNYTDGGQTDPNAKGNYLYSIAVVDDHDGHVYVYDPQIIIGTGDNLKKYSHKHPNTP
jgi:hypothetical protein